MAVDGGQSGLRLAAAGFPVVGTAAGFTFHGDPVTSTVAAVRAAAGATGLSGPVGVVCLGLTGLSRDAAEVRRLAAAVTDALDAEEARVCEDAVTAHAGALPDGSGVVVVAGTGTVCLAVGERGWHRVDGFGHLLGDTGSGFAVGVAGLRAALAAHDGRLGATALTDRARAIHGELRLLSHRIYASPTTVATIAAFAPEVFAAAADGDAVAADIVTDAASGLAASAAAAVRSLGGAEPVRVAYAGRLFEAGEPLLAPLRTRLAELAPEAALTPAAGTPLDGARRLAAGPVGAYAPLVTVYRRPRS